GRRWAVLILPLAMAAVMAMDAPFSRTHSPEERIRAALTDGLDSLALAFDAVQAAARAGTGAAPETARRARAIDAFRHARLVYKSVEGLLEYFDGMTASVLNGRENEAADADDEDPGSPPPDPVTGFAAVEANLAADSGNVGLAAVERHAM